MFINCNNISFKPSASKELFSFICNSFGCINSLNENSRHDIKIGSIVRVVQKNDQKTGKLTEGTVKEILTKSMTHPHGIKVVLENGIVGRVKELLR